MKKSFTILVFVLAGSWIARGQILYSENFNGGTHSFALNTSEIGSTSNGYNKWVVNDSYAGATIIPTICGFPTIITIPSTPWEPAAVAGNPTSRYLHITSIAADTSGVDNCNFVAPDSVCNFNESYFAKMGVDINTTGQSSVAISFWWLCLGDTGKCYGELYFSTDGGINWTPSISPIAKYDMTPSWHWQQISESIFLNQPTLRFGFRFVSAYSLVATDPSFGIDDVIIGPATGIAELIHENYSLAPNPCTSSTQISFTSNENKKLTCALYNLLGEKLKEETWRVEAGENHFTLSTENLPRGVYLLRIGDEKETSGKLLVVE